MLHVSQFKLEGCEGCSPFGRPTSIEDCPDLDAAMDKLGSIIPGSRRQSSSQMDEGSPIQSQFDYFNVRRRQLSPTSSMEPAFATQVFAGANDREQGTKGNPNRQPAQNSDGLLSILQHAQERKEQSFLNDNTTQAKMIPAENNTRKNPNFSVLRSLDGGKMGELSSRLDEKANRKHDEYFIPQAPAESTKESFLVPAGIKSPRQNMTTSVPPEDSEKENSQECLRTEISRGTKPLELPGSINHSAHVLQFLTFHDTDDGDLFKGLKRIPRSYVRVPDQQQAILERNNSWFQPRYDNQPSHGNNIPPEVLQDLSLFANRIVAQGGGQGQAIEPRSERGPGIDDSSGDVDTGAESEGNEEQNDVDDAALSEPDMSSSRIDGTRDGLLYAKTPNEAEERHLAASLLLDVEKDNVNEPANDEDEEDMNEEPSMSWSSSPQPAQRPHSNAIPENPNLGMPSSPSDLDMDIAGLPKIRDGGTPARTHAAPKTLKGFDTVFPFSSQASEDEIQMEVPHAIDEPVNEAADEQTDRQGSASPESSAARDGHIIQVEHTPISNPRESEKSMEPKAHPQGKKRRHEEILSDSVIPGTASDGRQQVYQGSLGKSNFKSQSMSSGKEMDNNDCYLATIQSSIDNGVMVDKDSIPNRLGHVESTQSITSSPIKATYEPQGTSGNSKLTASKTDEILASTASTASTLLSLQPLDGDRTLQDKEVPDDGSSYQVLKPPVHTRKVTRNTLISTNAKFSQEEYITKDTDEMIRASRRDFNAQLLAPKPKESDLTTRTALPASIRAQPNSDPYFDSSCGSTSSEVTQLIVPGTLDTERPSIVASERLPLGGAAPSPDASEMQTISAERDKDERTRESVSMGAQSGKQDSIDPSDFPEPANHRTAFDQFMLAYPSYHGSEVHFVNGLVYIEWLVNEHGKNFLRKSLWDDLIRVLADDYLKYIQDSSIPGKKMRGFEFYNELDQDAIFKQQIITPSNLQESISSLDSDQAQKVRRTYNIPQNHEKGKASSAVSPPEHLLQSKTTPPDQLCQREAEKTLNRAENPPVLLEDDSPALTVQPDSERMSSKQQFFEAHSQIRPEQLENGPEVVMSQEESPARAIPGNVMKTAPRRLFFETHSQLQAEQPASTPDAAIKSFEVPVAKAHKSPRRSLPWLVQRNTTIPSETRSGPSSPYDIRRLSNLPSKSPKSRLQTERDNNFRSGANSEPKTRAFPGFAPDDDPFASPKPRAPTAAARRPKSLPNARVERRRREKTPDGEVSDRRLAFLDKFARRRMSSHISTPEAKNIKRFCTIPIQATPERELEE